MLSSVMPSYPKTIISMSKFLRTQISPATLCEHPFYQQLYANTTSTNNHENLILFIMLGAILIVPYI